MTLNGAIMQLVEMRENSMMPAVFKPYLDKVIETISECVEPSEIPHWIPCSERLPEDRRLVLVTAYWHETYQVMMASYFGDGLWWCVPFNNCGEHMQRLNPKAWMPLPPAYREENDDDN